MPHVPERCSTLLIAIDCSVCLLKCLVSYWFSQRRRVSHIITCLARAAYHICGNAFKTWIRIFMSLSCQRLNVEHKNWSAQTLILTPQFYVVIVSIFFFFFFASEELCKLFWGGCCCFREANEKKKKKLAILLISVHWKCLWLRFTFSFICNNSFRAALINLKCFASTVKLKTRQKHCSHYHMHRH